MSVEQSVYRRLLSETQLTKEASPSLTNQLYDGDNARRMAMADGCPMVTKGRASEFRLEMEEGANLFHKTFKYFTRIPSAESHSSEEPEQSAWRPVTLPRFIPCSPTSLSRTHVEGIRRLAYCRSAAKLGVSESETSKGSSFERSDTASQYNNEYACENKKLLFLKLPPAIKKHGLHSQSAQMTPSQSRATTTASSCGEYEGDFLEMYSTTSDKEDIKTDLSVKIHDNKLKPTSVTAHPMPNWLDCTPHAILRPRRLHHITSTQKKTIRLIYNSFASNISARNISAPDPIGHNPHACDGASHDIHPHNPLSNDARSYKIPADNIPSHNVLPVSSYPMDCSSLDVCTSETNGMPIFPPLGNHQMIRPALDSHIRTIASTSVKEISEPNLSGDFYLNLVSWSASNILAYGVGERVRLWDGSEKMISSLDCSNVEQKRSFILPSTPTRLAATPCGSPFRPTTPLAHRYNGSVSSAYHNFVASDVVMSQSHRGRSPLPHQSTPTPLWVTSVSWHEQGCFLAVGLADGMVQLWDAEREIVLRNFEGHEQRVGSLSWGGHLISSGSRDQSVMTRDVRVGGGGVISSYVQHTQEVCGLVWSPDNRYLASGGNDNLVVIWDTHSCSERFLRLTSHNAAVKALAWSPHKAGLLVTGAGTADRTLRFWDVTSASLINSIDTGSQVCNVAWSKSADEVVSTHGYSLNQVIVWKYPSMKKVCTLTGHGHRVLYLSISPAGETIVTGAGGEGLKFWKVFPAQYGPSKQNPGLLLLDEDDIR